MGLTCAYWVHCDLCGTDGGSSKLTMEEAWDQVLRGDWWVNRHYQAAVCPDCFDETKTYHAQNSNIFCVLCQTGEHIAIIR